MSNIKHVLIDVKNLSDKEQIELWLNLWDFADKKLSPETRLMCFIIPKNKKVNK